ncbi:hypothetical protein GCM10008922_21890 [Faecalicatena contorta]
MCFAVTYVIIKDTAEILSYPAVPGSGRQYPPCTGKGKKQEMIILTHMVGI